MPVLIIVPPKLVRFSERDALLVAEDLNPSMENPDPTEADCSAAIRFALNVVATPSILHLKKSVAAVVPGKKSIEKLQLLVPKLMEKEMLPELAGIPLPVSTMV